MPRMKEKRLSLRLFDDELATIDERARSVRLSRSAYLRRATFAATGDAARHVNAEFLDGLQRELDSLADRGHLLRWFLEQDPPRAVLTINGLEAWRLWLKLSVPAGPLAGQLLRSMLGDFLHRSDSLSARVQAAASAVVEALPESRGDDDGARRRRLQPAITLPLSAEEWTRLDDIALDVGLPRETVVRRRALGQRVHSLQEVRFVSPLARAVADMGRVGGLLKWWLTIDEFWRPASQSLHYWRMWFNKHRPDVLEGVVDGEHSRARAAMLFLEIRQTHSRVESVVQAVIGESLSERTG